MIKFIRKTKELLGTYLWLDNKHAIVFRNKYFNLIEERYAQCEIIAKDYNIQDLYRKYIEGKW